MKESLIWKKFPVLNDGFVCLVDVMGEDSSICQSARVCYGDGTKKTSNDRALIRYLMRHEHLSPFEMCELKFMWRVPMDVWRQVVRHRTASINEYSTRYSIAIDSTYQTQENEWRLQSASNKQGSEGLLDIERGKELTSEEQKAHYIAKAVYDDMLNNGVSRELARKNLPLATYTEAYWKIDLRNLLHFLSLRMDNHAQYEIRQYANVIGNEIVAKLFPYTWEAFNDFVVNSYTFTSYELNVLCYLSSKYLCHRIYGKEELKTLIMNETAPIIPKEWFNDKCRERDEFVEKIGGKDFAFLPQE